jgi:TatD DNase family protein
MLIDTHCHLDRPSFPEGPEPVLERARAAGVGAFVVIGVGGVPLATAAVELARRRADVVATVGVHPHEAKSLDAELEAALEELSLDPRVVAIGEIGLDHHYDLSPRDVQAAVFRKMVGLARARRLPVVIHTRRAPKETLAILESEGAREVGGVIHCFSEDRAFAARALDLGFDLSFSGIVTFKAAETIREVAAWAPLDRILVETDSPYLAPVPLRGKRCEPAYLVHTATFLAEIRGTTLDDIGKITRENALRRFGPALGAPAAPVQN